MELCKSSPAETMVMDVLGGLGGAQIKADLGFEKSTVGQKPPQNPKSE